MNEPRFFKHANGFNNDDVDCIVFADPRGTSSAAVLKKDGLMRAAHTNLRFDEAMILVSAGVLVEVTNDTAYRRSAQV